MKKDLFEPIVIPGREIASSWWGKAWCKNIDYYADYDNRIPRGRSYVRSGAVIDLKINKGEIRAKVQGSRAKPYDILIQIKPLSDERIKEIEDKCRNNFESIEEFLEGRFPESFKEYFTSSSLGLFPQMKEIHFKCSCPDWASLCKHIAACLYGIGRKFDSDPMLLFRLRGIDTDSFASSIVNREAERLALSSRMILKEGRAMKIKDASLLFNIDSYEED